jgi:hypothetical protein
MQENWLRSVMKKFLVLLVLFIISFESLIACTVEITPLRKEFRQANSVFTGKILEVEDIDLTEMEIQKLIPREWRDLNVFSKVTVEIKDKWKGNASGTKEFWSVAFGTCSCDPPKQFEIGKEYLIFAERSNFIAFCDSKPITINWAKSEIKQLDSFGFRLWARIYPF